MVSKMDSYKYVEGSHHRVQNECLWACREVHTMTYEMDTYEHVEGSRYGVQNEHF